MKRNGFYRNKYLICIYGPLSEGETLITICDNAREFAQLMEIKESCARMILQNLFYKKHHYLKFFGKLCTVEFIDFLNLK